MKKLIIIILISLCVDAYAVTHYPLGGNSVFSHSSSKGHAK